MIEEKYVQEGVNPFLPSWEYIPDGEPHLFDGRVYLFGSHDRFGSNQFCQNDYVCWSAPEDDLTHWTYHGVMYRRLQDPDADETHFLQAPDVTQGTDGRFYLYYNLALLPFVSVAVSDYPEGPYEYLGRVKKSGGEIVGSGAHDVFMFDPGVLKDDDGRVYLYAGFGPADDGPLGFACSKYRMNGAYVCELQQDMLTVKSEPHLLVPKAGHTSDAPDFNTDISEAYAFPGNQNNMLRPADCFRGHEFYEASSMRKVGNTYYFIYSSVQSHELCYAVSKFPDRKFVYGGTLVSNADAGINGNTVFRNYTGNTHGSIICVKDQWYVFYHRQTNRCQYARQACAEKITMKENGRFLQAEITSCGLAKRALPGEGIFEARIACNLFLSDLSESNISAYNYDKESNDLSEEEKELHPFFTQSGNDREENPDQYIANMRNGACCGYKYFAFDGTSAIKLWIRGKAKGKLYVFSKPVYPECPIDTADADACIPVNINTEEWESVAGNFSPISQTKPIFLLYAGEGSIDLKSFSLEK